MQIALMLALFSLLAGVMSSYVVTAVVSTPQLSKALASETLAYFRGVDRVVNREFTPNQLQAMPVNMTMQDFMNQSAIRQLAPGQWGNPMLDAWGRSLRVMRQPLRQTVALSREVSVPVTGFVFISAGADGVFQTELPSQQIAGSTNTAGLNLARLQSIVAPTGSDDLVFAFTDEEAQRETYAMVKARLERIATVMMKDYQTKINVFKAVHDEAYRVQLLTNPTAVAPDLTVLLLTDPNAPSFADVNTEAARRDLGVLEEFVALERMLPNNGRMRVELTSSNLRLGATLTLSNFSTSPSPWPVVNLSIVLNGGIN